jgi:hypothetical protein
LSLPDYARLALIGLLLLLLQLALIQGFPGWRTGFEFYAPFLLLLAASRGSILAGVFALAGGAIMDSYSNQFIIFHILFYLIPVALGSLVRAHVLSEYRMLGAISTAAIMLLKVVLMLIAGIAMGWLPSAAYLFKVNYLPILFTSSLLYFAWPGISRVMGVAQGRTLG